MNFTAGHIKGSVSSSYSEWSGTDNERKFFVGKLKNQKKFLQSNPTIDDDDVIDDSQDDEDVIEDSQSDDNDSEENVYYKSSYN